MMEAIISVIYFYTKHLWSMAVNSKCITFKIAQSFNDLLCSECYETKKKCVVVNVLKDEFFNIEPCRQILFSCLKTYVFCEAGQNIGKLKLLYFNIQVKANIVCMKQFF